MYVLRLHRNVAGQDFTKYLKQVQVRPFVLLHLLYFLIEHNHKVFCGKGSVQTLKAKMEAAVEKRYPDAEKHLPEERREGFVPKVILDNIHRQQKLEQCRAKRARLVEEKQATPGDGARALESCLDDVRPFSITNSRSTSAASEPASIREGALNRFGHLDVHTKADAIPQWESQYFSHILPFVLPYMASRPDCHPNQRWRRNFDGVPFLSPEAFSATSAGASSGSVVQTGQVCQ